MHRKPPTNAPSLFFSGPSLLIFLPALTLFSVPCGVIWTPILFKGSFLPIWSRSPAWKSTYLKYFLAWRGNNCPYESYLPRPMFYAVVRERSSPPLDEDQFVSIPLLLNRMEKVEVLRSSGNIFFLFPAFLLPVSPCSPTLSSVTASHLAIATPTCLPVLELSQFSSPGWYLWLSQDAGAALAPPGSLP